jgi:hypothetical protein
LTLYKIKRITKYENWKDSNLKCKFAFLKQWKTVYFQTSITHRFTLAWRNPTSSSCPKLRDFIIDIVAVKKGILAQTWVIELTIALHYVLTLQMIYWFGMWAIKHMDIKSWPAEEKFSYQSSTRRYFWFPKRSESYDTFGVGHPQLLFRRSGMAIASNLKGEFNKHHIAIIGDASILQVWLLKVKSRGSYWC